MCEAWCTFHAHDALFNLKVDLTVENKLFNVKAKRRNVEIILAPIFFLFRVASTAYSIPSLFGILVYRESTSMELISMLLIFRLKYV